MGWNTTVVILNDRLGDIADDPSFGSRLAFAVGQQFGTGEQLDFGYGAIVVEQHHADGTAVVCVGGNDGSVLGFSLTHRHRDSDSRLRILKDVAEGLGYRLVRKGDRKSFAAPAGPRAAGGVTK